MTFNRQLNNSNPEIIPLITSTSSSGIFHRNLYRFNSGVDCPVKREFRRNTWFFRRTVVHTKRSEKRNRQRSFFVIEPLFSAARSWRINFRVFDTRVMCSIVCSISRSFSMSFSAWLASSSPLFMRAASVFTSTMASFSVS